MTEKEKTNNEENLVIDSENFEQYFFDARKHRPEKGQIMAKYIAVAEFVEGQGKRDIMYLLKQDKAYQATQVMKKIHGAVDPDCYRVCREIAEDFMNGKTNEEVEKKSYKFITEYFFYTKREYVPKNDPHWETIQVVDYDQDTGEFKSTIEI
jgi:hypothetical protein